MKTRILSATSLNGTNVKNLKKENIGEIQDLMVNLETGKVEYAVLSFGGFLGIGDKYFAVPIEVLQVSTKDREIMLDIDKERLKNAPGFDKDNWPSHADSKFTQSVYSHYGYKPQQEFVRR